MVQSKKVTLVAPYPEGAALAIATAADRAGILGGWIQPVPVQMLAVPVLRHLPGSQSLIGRISRRDVNLSVSTGVGPCLELIRLGLSAGGGQRLRRGWMYAEAVAVSRMAARRLPTEPGIVVGMPGACVEVFRRAKDLGSRTIFHAVNSRPRTHNAMLRAHFPEEDLSGELVPSWIEDRVEQELSFADQILAPSRFVKAQMTDEQSSTSPNRVLYQPYGSDFSVSIDELGIARMNKGRPRLLFVGQVGFRKGIPHLLSAMAGTDAQLDIVGPMVSKAATRNAPSNVRFLSTLPAREIRRLMTTADAFILPSVEDACALVTMEAAAMGLPVITTRQNGAHELLGKKDGSLVDAGDVAALREAVLRIVPLSAADRVERSERLRRAGGGVLSWRDYGTAVITMLEGDGS